MTAGYFCSNGVLKLPFDNWLLLTAGLTQFWTIINLDAARRALHCIVTSLLIILEPIKTRDLIRRISRPPRGLIKLSVDNSCN